MSASGGSASDLIGRCLFIAVVLYQPLIALLNGHSPKAQSDLMAKGINMQDAQHQLITWLHGGAWIFRWRVGQFTG
jgi:hypothetical protein